MSVTGSRCGIGLRSIHYQELIKNLPDIDLIEISFENFLNTNLCDSLELLAQNYNLSFHCVSMSLGSTDKINIDYLKRLKELIDVYQPSIVSDHLSWSSISDIYLHDLLPLIYTKESFELFKSKIDYVQNYLGRQILIENPSLYTSFPASTLCETDFLNNLVQSTGCGILLDINNLYVSSCNLSYNPVEYIDQIDSEGVKQLHIAGYEKNKDGMLIDTHSCAPSPEVISLFKYFIKNYGLRPTIFEQDQNLGSLESLLKQASDIDNLIDDNCN